MATLTPILTGTPGNPPTYSVGMAETFSWVPVENDADRPLYARATYLTNADDIKVQLSASSINLNLEEIELNTDNIEELIDFTNATLSAFKFETNQKIDKTSTLLNVLTGTQYQSVSLLNTLTANTDKLEEFVQENTARLIGLTAIQADKQNQIITLLNQLTSNTDTLEINTDNVENLLSVSNTLLNNITAANINVPGFKIPPYDEINMEYVGTTDYLRKAVYLNSSTQVLALSFVYVTEPPTSSDNRILKVKKI